MTTTTDDAAAGIRDQPDHAFWAEWQQWHQAKEANLASPHGFLAITSIRFLGPEPGRFSDAPGSWSSDDAGVHVSLEPGEQLELDGRTITGRYDFGVVPERSGIFVTAGDAVIEIAKRGGFDIIRPRHPEHPLRRDFRGTPAYDPDPRWVVTGRYVPFDEPRPTTVGAAVEGLQHVYEAPGRVEFELDGRELALTVFESHGGLLALFTDETSGRTTYAANRSLKIDEPAADGSVLLDFNRAGNLPCAYTDFATCPLPPAENRLPVAIEAGEQIPYERR